MSTSWASYAWKTRGCVYVLGSTCKDAGIDALKGNGHESMQQ